MKDFIMTALPWILAGLLVAVAAANKIRIIHKEKKTADEESRQVDERQKEADNYGLLGMCIGMALGLMIGTCIKKDGDK